MQEVTQQKYLDPSSIDYNAVSTLVVEDFLLNRQDLEHRTRSVRYTLSSILAICFPKSLYRQKYRHRDGRILPKYAKWWAPLSNIQCPMEKTELLPLPTLALDKASISGTIDILKEYLKRLDRRRSA